MHNLLRFYYFHSFFPFQNVFKDFTEESGIDHVYDIYESGGFGEGVAVLILTMTDLKLYLLRKVF